MSYPGSKSRIAERRLRFAQQSGRIQSAPRNNSIGNTFRQPVDPLYLKKQERLNRFGNGPNASADTHPTLHSFEASGSAQAASSSSKFGSTEIDNEEQVYIFIH